MIYIYIFIYILPKQRHPSALVRFFIICHYKSINNRWKSRSIFQYILSPSSLSPVNLQTLQYSGVFLGIIKIQSSHDICNNLLNNDFWKCVVVWSGRPWMNCPFMQYSCLYSCVLCICRYWNKLYFKPVLPQDANYVVEKTYPLTSYERLHPKRSTSYPQRWKKI